MKKRFELQKRTSPDGDFYAARCNPLGLTAYGADANMAWDRLGKMFTMLVDAAGGRTDFEEDKDGNKI